MISRNDPCWCGSNQKWKKCHFPQLPNQNTSNQKHKNLSVKDLYFNKFGIILKTEEQIQKIHHACQVTAKILDALCKSAKAGVTTKQLDMLSRKLHAEHNAIAAPLGYGSPPFPATICTSLNEVICHGIPDNRPLQDGDIVNIDVSCIVDGYYGDSSRMVIIGDTTEEKKRVVETSLLALNESIAICKPGVLVSDIGSVIEKVAKEHKCSVVNQFVGHGVGIEFHEAPEIPHHYNKINIPLVPGMTFTIEPMINAGVREAVIDNDQWTARTKDGKPSAQWEHTILITEDGHKILTLI